TRPGSMPTCRPNGASGVEEASDELPPRKELGMTEFASDTAMVMAAGLGKRMRPLTASPPKPMVRVAGKPMIDHALDRLQEAGISRAVINVHYFPDVLEAHLAERKNPAITISDERAQLLET